MTYVATALTSASSSGAGCSFGASIASAMIFGLRWVSNVPRDTLSDGSVT
jgi:hydroxymethylpyrimidine/phosphomethylpyrimidine kinase